MCVKFRTFWKNDEGSSLIISDIIATELLLKRLEGLASEHHSVINVLTGSKHRLK